MRPKPKRGANIVFQPGDWVHMRRERFSAPRKSKLQPQGDGSFHIFKRINDDAYKVDMSREYGFSAIFNGFDLTMFDVGDDSRSNPFEERGMIRINPTPSVIMPTTHWRCQLGQLATKLKEALNGHVQNI